MTPINNLKLVWFENPLDLKLPKATTTHSKQDIKIYFDFKRL